MGLLLLGFSAAAAQVQEITGQVVGHGGPVRGLYVSLTDSTGRVCMGAPTDRQGQFWLSGVPPGTYTLEGRMGDYLLQQPVNIPADAPGGIHHLGILQWQHAPTHLPGLPLPPNRDGRPRRRRD